VDDRTDVEVDDLERVGELHLPHEVASGRRARVEREQVERALHRPGQPLDLGRNRQVAPDGDHRRAPGTDGCCRLLERLVERRDHEVEAAPAQLERQAAADAAGGTGDERERAGRGRHVRAVPGRRRAGAPGCQLTPCTNPVLRRTGTRCTRRALVECRPPARRDEPGRFPTPREKERTCADSPCPPSPPWPPPEPSRPPAAAAPSGGICGSIQVTVNGTDVVNQSLCQVLPPE
jgi:hypothetical protein